MLHDHNHGWSHHICCALGVGFAGWFLSADWGLKFSTILTQNSHNFNSPSTWRNDPRIYKLLFPVGGAVVGLVAGPVVETVFDGALTLWGLIKDNDQNNNLRGIEITNGEKNMNSEAEIFVGKESDIHGVSKEKQGLVSLVPSSIIYDQDSSDNFIQASQQGSYIFPREGRQIIELGMGQDNVVISLCSSKISSNGEVLVISNLGENDKIFVGCSKGAVNHKDFSFEYRSSENLTYVYIYKAVSGDTVASVTDQTQQLRGAFAVRGDFSSSLNDYIVTVEDHERLAEVESQVLPCFPNVFLGPDPDDFKNIICEWLGKHNPCCEIIGYQVGALGTIEEEHRDHSHCHHG